MIGTRRVFLSTFLMFHQVPLKIFNARTNAEPGMKSNNEAFFETGFLFI